MVTFTLECYGWVALALPVWADLFTGLSGSHETSAYTGRASATQPCVTPIVFQFFWNEP